MTVAPTSNREALVTVYDILWSWSLGRISKVEAISLMELDDELDLYEAAVANDVPVPGQPSALDVRQAEEFLSVVSVAARSPTAVAACNSGKLKPDR